MVRFYGWLAWASSSAACSALVLGLLITSGQMARSDEGEGGVLFAGEMCFATSCAVNDCVSPTPKCEKYPPPPLPGFCQCRS